jgi:uncharacterized membrane protein YqjE
MTHSADGGHAAPSHPSSTADLVRQLSEQASRLVREELHLALLEMTRKGKQAGAGVGMFGVSSFVALYGMGCLIACVIIAISGAVAAWLSALIVGAALLSVAGLLALAGKGRLSKATPPVPKAALASVQSDIETIKERAHR